MRDLKIAIVHDYLNQMGGAERVVAVLHKMFPEAPIYTTIVDRDKLLPELQNAVIHTTWMQRIPGILNKFKLYFWLYPFSIRSINVKSYDLILSSSSAYAKGVRKGRQSLHVCYCYTPMRFVWDFDTYMESIQVPRLVKRIAKWLIYPLKRWDKNNSEHVDRLIAISTIVKERIKQCYGVNAPIIFPPVEVSRFSVKEGEPEDYFLVVSRLVSYKKIDLAIEACTQSGKRLIVIGDGPDRQRLEQLAGDTITFLGRKSDEDVVRYMQNCKALIFPGIEDFGITPLEANACGRPIIAYYGGGALDTIIAEQTGLYFKEQSINSLKSTINRFDQYNWDPQYIRQHAEQFSEYIFIERMQSIIESSLKSREINSTIPEPEGSY
ncbi:glycosyltransferase [Paenibacillus sp. MDMC362]|uniref:glycosyltransferase n=1 Tax=Paenibacillus sp. MDMC362 TaxID=2977365 RepID=UPI000DC36FC8|nr:glycosyltransferase [Paenibacillus sp. MDMC362]RAR43025.1 glycosyltransferase family 4 protein [Paenibacillus sp. MDMC362]